MKKIRKVIVETTKQIRKHSWKDDDIEWIRLEDIRWWVKEYHKKHKK